MNELCLFAGAGGGSIASYHFHKWRTVCYVEKDKYCQKVLQARIKDGLLSDAPIWDDIKTFDGKPWRGCVDIITAGFPCQPFSVAGKRDWKTSENNLWPETKRVIKETSPKYILLENVPGISAYLPVVVRDLRRVGYTVKRPLVVSAANTGALHIRKRVWIFAYSNGDGWDGFWNKCETRKRPQVWIEFEGLVQDILQSCVSANRGSGIHDGLANRVDRLKAIGNGQVPQCAFEAWKILTENP